MAVIFVRNFINKSDYKSGKQSTYYSYDDSYYKFHNGSHSVITPILVRVSMIN
jgi:hypothetical protein